MPKATQLLVCVEKTCLRELKCWDQSLLTGPRLCRGTTLGFCHQLVVNEASRPRASGTRAERAWDKVKVISSPGPRSALPRPRITTHPTHPQLARGRTAGRSGGRRSATFPRKRRPKWRGEHQGRLQVGEWKAAEARRPEHAGSRQGGGRRTLSTGRAVGDSEGRRSGKLRQS